MIKLQNKNSINQIDNSEQNLSNQISNIDKDTKVSLIPKVIHIMQTLPDKTKLINKSFFLVPKLFNLNECDVINYNKFIQLLFFSKSFALPVYIVHFG